MRPAIYFVLSVVLFGALMPAPFAEQVDEGDDQYISTIYQFVKTYGCTIAKYCALACSLYRNVEGEEIQFPSQIWNQMRFAANGDNEDVDKVDMNQVKQFIKTYVRLPIFQRCCRNL